MHYQLASFNCNCLAIIYFIYFTGCSKSFIVFHHYTVIINISIYVYREENYYYYYYYYYEVRLHPLETA